MACTSCGANIASRAGSSLNSAIIFGEPTDEVHRVRVMEDLPGLQMGAVKYVRGTHVQQLVDEGKLSILAGGSRVLPRRAGGVTLYYVGDVGYSTMEQARVRAGQTGEEIVVRTFGG